MRKKDITLQQKIKNMIWEIDNERYSDMIIENTDTLNSIGLDSLDIVELTLKFEKQFNISIPDKDVESFKDKTIADLTIYLSNYNLN